VFVHFDNNNNQLINPDDGEEMPLQTTIHFAPTNTSADGTSSYITKNSHPEIKHQIYRTVTFPFKFSEETVE